MPNPPLAPHSTAFGSPLHGWEWLQNQWIPCNALPLSDRGFRYGMSVFESLRLQDGHLHFANAHWQRLLHGARQLGFPAPPDAAQLQSLPIAQTLPGSWFVRWYLTAGDGPPLAPIANPRFLLLAEPRDRKPVSPLKVSLPVSPFFANFGGLKTGNYWPRIAALAEAHSRGFEECLLLDPQDCLASAAFANVFIHLKNHGWVTPPCTDGARDGVARAWLLAHGLARERSLRRAELAQADAALLCNSWMGMVPIALLEDRTLRLAPESEQWREAFGAAQGEATLA